MVAKNRRKDLNMLDSQNKWTLWTGWSQYADKDPDLTQRKIDNVLFAFVDNVLKQNLDNPNPIGYNIEDSGLLDLDLDTLHEISDLTAKCEYYIPTNNDNLYGDCITIQFYHFHRYYKRLAVISVSDYGNQQYVLG